MQGKRAYKIIDREKMKRKGKGNKGIANNKKVHLHEQLSDAWTHHQSMRGVAVDPSTRLPTGPGHDPRGADVLRTLD